MPDRDRYYIEHGDRTNTFHFRQNKKQEEKDDLFLFLINLDKKNGRIEDKVELSRLKCMKAEAKQHYKDLDQDYVD